MSAGTVEIGVRSPELPATALHPPYLRREHISRDVRKENVEQFTLGDENELPRSKLRGIKIKSSTRNEASFEELTPC